LAAVFLALGLGVLIGTALPGDRLWLEQQQALLNALEQEFHSLRSQARAYREELSALEEERAAMDRLLETLAPLAVEGRLTGATVALLVAGEGDRPDAPWADEVERLLAWAGAGHVWWLHLPAAPAGGPMGPLGSGEGDGSGGPGPVLPGGLLDAVLAGDGERLARWALAGWITLSGEPRQPQGVAFIQQGPVDEGLLGDRWRELGIPVVPGVEGAAGRIALVLRLAGYDPPFMEAGLP